MTQQGRLNCSGLPQYHLKRNGPNATAPGVASIMDFHKVTTLIGRNRSQVDYVLDSSTYTKSAYISRNHARVVRQVRNSDTHRLFDDSLNGVFVNNFKIAGSIVLSEGDLVTFGHPNGSNIAAGDRCRQPDSEYQFLFERCDCKQLDDSTLHPIDKGFAVPIRPSPPGKCIKKRNRNTTQSFTTEDVLKLRDSCKTVTIKRSQNDKKIAFKKTRISTGKDESMDKELSFQPVLLPSSQEKEMSNNNSNNEEIATNSSNSSSNGKIDWVHETGEKRSPPKNVALQTSDVDSDSQSQKCFKKHFTKKSPMKDASIQTTPAGVGNRNSKNCRSESTESDTSSADFVNNNQSSDPLVAMETSFEELSVNSTEKSSKIHVDKVENIEMIEIQKQKVKDTDIRNSENINKEYVLEGPNESVSMGTSENLSDNLATESEAKIFEVLDAVSDNQEATNTSARHAGNQDGESILRMNKDQEINPSAASFENLLKSSDKQNVSLVTENNMDDSTTECSLQTDCSIAHDTDEKKTVNTNNIIFSNSIDYQPEFYHDFSDDEFMDQEENIDTNNADNSSSGDTKNRTSWNAENNNSEDAKIRSSGGTENSISGYANNSSSGGAGNSISGYANNSSSGDAEKDISWNAENNISGNAKKSSRGDPENSTNGYDENSANGDDENSISGEADNSSSADAENSTSGHDAENSTSGDAENSTNGDADNNISREAENSSSVNAENSTIGGAEYNTSGKVENSTNRDAEEITTGDMENSSRGDDENSTNGNAGDNMKSNAEENLTLNKASSVQEFSNVEKDESFEESIEANIKKENNRENVEVKLGGVQEISNKDINNPAETEISKHNFISEVTEPSLLTNGPSEVSEQVKVEVTETGSQDSFSLTSVNGEQTNFSEVSEKKMVADDEISEVVTVTETDVCVMSEKREEADLSLHIEKDDITNSGNKKSLSGNVSDQISTEVIASQSDFYEKPVDDPTEVIASQSDFYEKPVDEGEKMESNLVLQNENSLSPLSKNIAALQEFNKHLSPFVKSSQQSSASLITRELSSLSKRKRDQAIISEMVSCLEESISSAGEISEDEDSIEGKGDYLIEEGGNPMNKTIDGSDSNKKDHFASVPNVDEENVRQDTAEKPSDFASSCLESGIVHSDVQSIDDEENDKAIVDVLVKFQDVDICYEVKDKKELDREMVYRGTDTANSFDGITDTVKNQVLSEKVNKNGVVNIDRVESHKTVECVELDQMNVDATNAEEAENISKSFAEKNEFVERTDTGVCDKTDISVTDISQSNTVNNLDDAKVDRTVASLSGSLELDIVGCVEDITDNKVYKTFPIAAQNHESKADRSIEGSTTASFVDKTPVLESDVIESKNFDHNDVKEFGDILDNCKSETENSSVDIGSSEVRDQKFGKIVDDFHIKDNSIIYETPPSNLEAEKTVAIETENIEVQADKMAERIKDFNSFDQMKFDRRSENTCIEGESNEKTANFSYLANKVENETVLSSQLELEDENDFEALSQVFPVVTGNSLSVSGSCECLDNEVDEDNIHVMKDEDECLMKVLQTEIPVKNDEVLIDNTSKQPKDEIKDDDVQGDRNQNVCEMGKNEDQKKTEPQMKMVDLNTSTLLVINSSNKLINEDKNFHDEDARNCEENNNNNNNMETKENQNMSYSVECKHEDQNSKEKELSVEGDSRCLSISGVTGENETLEVICKNENLQKETWHPQSEDYIKKADNIQTTDVMSFKENSKGTIVNSTPPCIEENSTQITSEDTKSIPNCDGKMIRKRRFSEVETNNDNEDIQKRSCVEDEKSFLDEAKTVLSNFFRIRSTVIKDRQPDKKLLKRKLVGKIVKNFFKSEFKSSKKIEIDKDLFKVTDFSNCLNNSNFFVSFDQMPQKMEHSTDSSQEEQRGGLMSDFVTNGRACESDIQPNLNLCSSKDKETEKLSINLNDRVQGEDRCDFQNESICSKHLENGNKKSVDVNDCLTGNKSFVPLEVEKTAMQAKSGDMHSRDTNSVERNENKNGASCDLQVKEDFNTVEPISQKKNANSNMGETDCQNSNSNIEYVFSQAVAGDENVDLSTDIQNRDSIHITREEFKNESLSDDLSVSELIGDSENDFDGNYRPVPNSWKLVYISNAEKDTPSSYGDMSQERSVETQISIESTTSTQEDRNDCTQKPSSVLNCTVEMDERDGLIHLDENSFDDISKTESAEILETDKTLNADELSKLQVTAAENVEKDSNESNGFDTDCSETSQSLLLLPANMAAEGDDSDEHDMLLNVNDATLDKTIDTTSDLQLSETNKMDAVCKTFIASDFEIQNEKKEDESQMNDDQNSSDFKACSPNMDDIEESQSILNLPSASLNYSDGEVTGTDADSISRPDDEAKVVSENAEDVGIKEDVAKMNICKKKIMDEGSNEQNMKGNVSFGETEKDLIQESEMETQKSEDVKTAYSSSSIELLSLESSVYESHLSDYEQNVSSTGNGESEYLKPEATTGQEPGKNSEEDFQANDKIQMEQPQYSYEQDSLGDSDRNGSTGREMDSSNDYFRLHHSNSSSYFDQDSVTDSELLRCETNSKMCLKTDSPKSQLPDMEFESNANETTVLYQFEEMKSPKFSSSLENLSDSDEDLPEVTFLRSEGPSDKIQTLQVKKELMSDSDCEEKRLLTPKKKSEKKRAKKKFKSSKCNESPDSDIDKERLPRRKSPKKKRRKIDPLFENSDIVIVSDSETDSDMHTKKATDTESSDLVRVRTSDVTESYAGTGSIQDVFNSEEFDDNGSDAQPVSRIKREVISELHNGGDDSSNEEAYNEDSDLNDDEAVGGILEQETQYFGNGTPQKMKSCSDFIINADVDNDNNQNDVTREIENESNVDCNTPDILDILHQETQYVVDPGDESPTLNSEIIQTIVETGNMTYSQICREITGDTENGKDTELSGEISHDTPVICKMAPSVDTAMEDQTFEKDHASVVTSTLIRREDTPISDTTSSTTGKDDEYAPNTCDSDSQTDVIFPVLKSLTHNLNSNPSRLSVSEQPIRDKNQSLNRDADPDVGNPGSRLFDMDFSCQSDEDFSPLAVNMAALDSESEHNDNSEISCDQEPIASTSHQSEGLNKKRRLFDSDEMDSNRISSPKKRSKSGDAGSPSIIVDIESLGKVNSPLSDIEDYTDSNMDDKPFGKNTNNFIQNINKKRKLSGKTKAQELLAKLKAKRDKFKTHGEPVQREITAFQTADDAGPSSLSTQRPEAEHTNVNIESYMARCKEVVCKLKDSFNNHQNLHDNPRIIQWKKEAEELEKKIKLPQTVIAVVGDTGCGKSSLMNALIDQLDVLPTSGVRACTAVVVEITDNKRNDVFEADVQFLSKKEWHDELKVLLKDLTGADGKIKKNVPDPQSEAGVAYLKIKAVYGRIDTFEALSRCNTVTRWLDSTKTINSRNAKEFRRAIDKYIETADPGSGGQFWPIVKLVTVRIPNCDVCSSGAILVDLPGVRDSNAARDKIARDYLKRCTTVWVVSSIHRAIDDKTAKDLLGENFRRQLLMDGQYGSLAFICTKSDILVPSEIIQGLKLHNQTDPLENEIQGLQMEKADADLLVANADSDITQMKRNMEKIESEITELKGDIKELQNLQELNDSMDQDDDCEIQQQIKECEEIIASKEEAIRVTESDVKERKIAKNDANRRSLEIDKEMRVKRKKIATICAQARNEYARREIKRDFKAGLREMKRKAGMTLDEEEEDMVDDYDSDNDDEDIGSTASNLKVFCVSSVEYQKMKKILANNGPPVVFNKMEDTEILALRRYVHEMTSIRRSQGTERTICNVSRFVFDIQNYLMDNGTECKGTRLNARSTIEGRSRQLQEEILPVIQKLTNDIDEAFNGSIKPKIQDGVNNACSSAVEIQGKWARKSNKENRREGGLHWMTYKATILRQGVYTSPTYGAIDMNEALSEPLYRSITITWDKVFSGMLWNALETCSSMLLAVLKQFTTDLCEELHSLGVPSERTKRVLGHFLGSASNKLSEMVNHLKEFITSSQRDINRVLTPVIQNKLNDTYDKSASESGSGMFVRMKDDMSTGVDVQRFIMFDEASKKLLKDLLDLQTQIIDHVNFVCKVLCDLIETSFEPLWEAPVNSKMLKKALFESITDISMTMNNLQQEANIPQSERHVSTMSEHFVSIPAASHHQSIQANTSNLHSVPRVTNEITVSTMSFPMPRVTPFILPVVSRSEENSSNASFGQRPALYPSTSTPRIKQEPMDEGKDRMNTSNNNSVRLPPYQQICIKQEKTEDESNNCNSSSSILKQQHTMTSQAGPSPILTVPSSYGPQKMSSKSLQNCKSSEQNRTVSSDFPVSQSFTLQNVNTQVCVNTQIQNDKTDDNQKRNATNSQLRSTESETDTEMPKLVSKRHPLQQTCMAINNPKSFLAGGIKNSQINAELDSSNKSIGTETLKVAANTNPLVYAGQGQLVQNTSTPTNAGISTVNDIVNPGLARVMVPSINPGSKGNVLMSNNGTQYIVPVAQMGQVAIKNGIPLTGNSAFVNRPLVSCINKGMLERQPVPPSMILPNGNRINRTQVNNNLQIQATVNRIILPNGMVYNQLIPVGSAPNMTLPNQTPSVTLQNHMLGASTTLYSIVTNIPGKATATLTKPHQTLNVDSTSKVLSSQNVHSHPNSATSQSSLVASEQRSSHLLHHIPKVNEPDRQLKDGPIPPNQLRVASFMGQQSLIGQSSVQQQSLIGQPSVQQQSLIGQSSVQQQSVIGQPSVQQQSLIGQSSAQQQSVIGQSSISRQSTKSTKVLSTITNTTKNLLNKGFEKSMKSILSKTSNDNHSKEINAPTEERSSMCDSPSTKSQEGNKLNKLSLSHKRNNNSPKLLTQPHDGSSTDTKSLHRRTFLSVKQEPVFYNEPRRKIRKVGYIDLTKSGDDDTDSD